MVGDVDSGGRSRLSGRLLLVWRQGVYGKSVTSAQFCWDPKTALKKIKSIKRDFF